MLRAADGAAKRGWRLPRLSLHVLLVALVSAGIVHITSTLAIPYMSPVTGYERLAEGLPVNERRVLPPLAQVANSCRSTTPDCRWPCARSISPPGR